ncbi:MAG: hypothetical protein P9M00_13710 [Candidatus Tritonobacter lacicola]|nr:hypothetical protein [Candidatus Tritonobacter lacicola]
MSPLFDEKCESCTEYSRCRDSLHSWIYFIIGLIATIAIRVVVIFQNVAPIYGKVAWYVGVVGFFVFFLYKFRVGHEREKHIERSGLVDKIDGREVLEEKDYENLGAILCSLSSRKERVNFFFIFATSVLAIALALYFDLFK